MNAVQVPHGVGGYLAVAVGAALGAWLRMLLGAWLNPLHPYFAFGTWAANLLGGLLVGMVVAAFARHPEIDAAWRLFLLTGFLGALTTFSTFSSESLALLQHGRIAWALAHSGAHLFGALAMAALGFRLLSQPLA